MNYEKNFKVTSKALINIVFLMEQNIFPRNI